MSNTRLQNSADSLGRELGMTGLDVFAAIERHKAERARRRRVVVVALVATVAALLVAVLAFADELVREGRYTLLDDQGQVVSEHNELHVAIREGQDWSRKNDGRTFYIEPPKYRGSVDADAEPPVVEPPLGAILVAPGDDIQAAIARLEPGGALLFERGGVYHSGLGRWRISGLSADRPTVVGAYGDPTLPRPKFLTDGDGLLHSYGDAPVRHVVFRDLHAVGGGGGEYGVRWSAAGRGIRFENMLIDGYACNLCLGERREYDIYDIAVHRCELLNAHSDSEISKGLFADRIQGLTITRCVLDHNGWAEGEVRSGFNHNAYIYQCRNVLVEGNVFSRGANLGLKLRADRPGVSHDIEIRGNLFVGNLTAMSIGGDPVVGDPDAILHERLAITGNAFAGNGSREPSGDTHGIAISIKQVSDAAIAGNLFCDKDPRDTYWYAIEVQPDKPSGEVAITGNVLDRWPAAASRSPLINDGGAAMSVVSLDGNLIETGAATRRLVDYDGDWLGAVEWLFEGVGSD